MIINIAMQHFTNIIIVILIIIIITIIIINRII